MTNALSCALGAAIGSMAAGLIILFVFLDALFPSWFGLSVFQVRQKVRKIQESASKKTEVDWNGLANEVSAEIDKVERKPFEVCSVIANTEHKPRG